MLNRNSPRSVEPASEASLPTEPGPMAGLCSGYHWLKCLRWLWLLPCLLMACTTVHCRRDGQKVVERNPELPKVYDEENLGLLRVAKSDGSRQCGMRAGISLADMAKEELSGVTIISSDKKHDGLMRIQSCGADTGVLNSYEIRQQDLLRAQKAGFKVLKTRKK